MKDARNRKWTFDKVVSIEKQSGESNYEVQVHRRATEPIDVKLAEILPR